MSNYNADIRIGVVGQSKLKTLQRDLDKVNSSVKKLNKALVLKTRAQTIKLNTQGATTAIKKLEDRINRLGRTVTVNVRTNDKKGSSNSSSSGGGSFGSAGAVASLGAATKNQQALDRLAKSQLDTAIKKEKTSAQVLKDQKDITALNKDLLDTQEELTKAQSAYTDKTEKVADLERRRNAATGQAKSLQTRLNKGQIKNVEAVKKAKVQMAEYKALASDLNSQIGNANKGYGNTNKLLERSNTLSQSLNEKEKQLTKTVNARAKAQVRSQKLRKGFGAGAGVAGASALGNIPVLGDAVTGGLVASFTGGSVAAGALGGALVGVISGLAAAGNQAAITRAQFDKLNISLKLAAGEDYAASVESIRRVVDDFNAPLVDTTEQFTKLYAASQGSGISFKELETLFVGLSAANKAYAGDAEDLNGILRAFTQIISKGTVQSEELKGQVGERLPGAFKKAADSLGLTTAQLQKALEQGEIQSADFVKAFGKYMLRYEEDAKIIADSPAEAGARLEVALVDLNNRIGPVFASLGAQFQDFGTAAVNALIPVIDYLNQLFDVGSNADRLDQKIGKVLTLNQKIFDVETKRNGLTDKTARNALAEDLASLTNRRDILQGEADELRKLLGAQKRTKEAANTIKPTALDPSKPKTGKGSSGPDRAKLAADMLEDQRRQLEILNAETDLEKNLLQIEYDRLDALKDVKEIEASKQAAAIKNAEDLAKAESGKAIGEALAADALEILEAEKERKAALDEILIPLQEQEKLLQARLNGNEKEVEMDLIIEDAKRRIKDIDVEALRNQLERINALETENELLSKQEQFWGSINRTIGDGLQRGIEGLIKGTESLNDVLSDVLGQLGSMFINAGISGLAGPGGLFGKQGLPGYRAEGGPISAGSPYIVGEEGPELVVPQSSGTVIPNDAFSAATAALSRGGGGAGIGPADDEAFSVASTAVQEKMSIMRQGQEQAINNPQPIDVRYQATVINNQTYVTAEQFQAGMSKTANQARAQTLKDLRNKPAARSRAGVS